MFHGSMRFVSDRWRLFGGLAEKRMAKPDYLLEITGVLYALQLYVKQARKTLT